MIAPWRRALAIWSLLTLLFLSGHAPAQPAARVSLQYRRVYVPVDQLAKMGTGYMILEREEFQQLLDTINAAPSGPGGSSARPTQAAYVARLDQNMLVGQATIDIQCNVKESAIVGLEPCSLAIATPHWDDASLAPARLGNNAAGKLAVVVEPAESDAALPRTSQLLFDWTLRGARDPSGAMLFDLQTPACPASSLELDLPKGTTPVVARGIVTKVASDPAKDGASGNSRQRWSIELGGDTRTTLSLISDEHLRQTSRYVLSRQATTYDLQPQGMEVEYSVDLDIFHEPLQQLAFRIDPGLQITSVRMGDKELEWATSAIADSPQQRLSIEFREPLEGYGRTLTISGWSGALWDETWSLPIIASSDILWQEGTLTLMVSPQLELRDLRTRRCQQTKSLPVPQAGEHFQFQCHRADAGLDIVVSVVRPQLRAREGLTLKWEDANLTAQLIADVEAARGQGFEIEANVPSPWTIDAVETTPPEALQDWAFTPQPNRNQKLLLRFAQSVNRERSVRVQVMARRNVAPQIEVLQARQYLPVFWQGLTVDQRLVSVQADAQQKLLLTGDAGLNRREIAELSQSERTRLDTSGSRVVFLDSSAGPQFGMSLRRENARYATAAITTAAVSSEHISEEHRLFVSPEGTAVGRLLIHFSPAHAEPLAWKLVDEQELLARQLNPAEQRQLGLMEGDAWELTLSRPRDVPFELIAQRQLKLTPETPTVPIALASFPEAETQAGEVRVNSEGGVPLVMESRALKPILLAEQAWSENLRGAFRYTPGQDNSLKVGLATATDGRRALWVWQQSLDCRLENHGATICTVGYKIENHGHSSLRVQLPDHARPRLAHVNGERVALSSRAQRELIIPLPADQRYVLVELEYGTTVTLPSLYGRASLDWPMVDCPVLASQARLWLPSDLALADAQFPSRYGWTAALSVRERLFGFLARPYDLSPPSLFSAAAWQRQAGHSRAADEARAVRCWDTLEQLMSPSPNDNLSLTWGQWLSGYEQLAADEAQAFLPIRIDASRLASLGIDAATELTLLGTLPVRGDQSPNRARDLLQQAGLGLVFHDDYILLTSHSAPEARAALAEAEVQGTPTPRDSYSTVAQWLAAPQPARSPWPLNTASLPHELPAVGWRQFELAPSGTETLDFVVYRPRDVQAIAWGLFLLTCAACAWWCYRRWSALVVIGVFFAATALLLPAALAACATALFLGTLAAAAVMLLLPPRATPSRSSPNQGVATPTSTATARTKALQAPTVTILLLGAMSLLAASWTFAQSPATPTETKPVEGAYRVLFPVDEDQQPANKYVYLPKPFYEALHREAAAAKAIPQGWMLYSATYRTQLQWEDVDVKLQAGNIVATYDLEVFQPKARVTIPLGRENVHPVDDRISLEGEAVQVEWLEGGDGFTFAVDKPGRFRMELVLQPTTRTIATREEIDFRIPRLARSRLMLRMPAEASGVQTPRAIGQQTQLAPGELQVELGPTTRLALQWPVNQVSVNVTNEVEVSQLMWWRIRPGSVVLDVRWKFKSGGQPLRDLRLIADPRLRLLPLSPESPVAEQSVRDGDVRAVHLSLREPYPQELTLETSFVLTGSSGVGSLILPRLEAVADRTTRRWLGVTASSPLVATTTDGAVHETIATKDFATAWGGEELPQQAFQLPVNASRFSLHVEPQAAQFSARQALTYAIVAGEVRAELEALVDVTSGALYQHRVALPEGFEPLEASITEGETTQAVRIARATADSLLLILPAGVSANHRLLVKARANVPTRQPWKLSLLELMGAEPPLAVFLERASNVRVKLRDLSGLEALPLLDEQPEPATGFRRVAMLRPLGVRHEREMTLDIRANRVDFEARQLTSLTRNNGGWQLDLDVYCKVLAGEVEMLRFDAPADIPTNFQSSLASRVEVLNIPGQTRPQLLVHLVQPQSADFRLQLTAPLATASSERLQTPDIRLLDAARQESYVWLPGRLEDQPIAWDTPGLQAIDRPNPAFGDFPEHGQYFLAGGARFQATIRRIERIAGVPQVRLADIHLRLGEDGMSVGAARFDLEPAGLAYVTLEMPQGVEFIRCLVNELPAVVQKRNDRRWQVQLRHEQLPQRLEVLFTHHWNQSPIGGDNLQLVAPSLLQLPVERTLWTVAPAATATRLAIADPNQAIDELRHTAFYLKNATTILERAAALMAESGGPEAVTWLTNWARETRPAQVLVARQALASSPSAMLAAEAEALQRELDAIEEQWKVPGLVEQELADRAPPRSLVEVHQLLEHDSQGVVRAMLPGSASEIEVKVTSQPSGQWVARVMAGFALLLSAIAVLLLMRAPMVRECVAQAPQLVGVGLGVAWWMLLEPAGVGLLIALLFTVSAFRWRWPRTGELSLSPNRRSSHARL